MIIYIWCIIYFDIYLVCWICGCNATGMLHGYCYAWAMSACSPNVNGGRDVWEVVVVVVGTMIVFVNGGVQVDPPREAMEDPTLGCCIVLKHLYWDLEAWNIELLCVLDFILKAYPKDGCHSLEEHYVSYVTFVSLGWIKHMQSLL